MISDVCHRPPPWTHAEQTILPPESHPDLHSLAYLRRLHPSGSIQRIVIIIEALLFSWIFWFILCGFFFQLSMLFSIDSLQLYDENDSFFPALRAVQRILIVLADIGMLGALR